MRTMSRTPSPKLDTFDTEVLTTTKESQTLADAARFLDEIFELGRKRNPKKELVVDLMQNWDPNQAYVVLRILDGDTFSDPHKNVGLEDEQYVEAIAAAFHDGDVTFVREGIEENGSVSRFLRQVDPTVESLFSDKAMYPTELYEAVCNIDEWGDRPDETERLVELLTMAGDHAWVLTYLLRNDMAPYFGASMMSSCIPDAFDEFTDSRVEKAVQVHRDVPDIFYRIRSERPIPVELYPHCLMGTMKGQSSYLPEDIDELQESGKWLAQTKYDGARIFVHRDSGGVRAYTAGNIDVTEALPELNDIEWPDESFIFDGEAVAYSPKDEYLTVKPYQHIMERLTRLGGVDEAREETEVVFKFFDCPYWRAMDISERSFEDRFQVVLNTFDPPNIARTGSDLAATFRASISNGHEGVMMKQLGSSYVPGSRTSTWQKWKAAPETADVIVTDMERGSGRLSDRIGALEIACHYDGEEYPLGSVGTGFSDEERLDWWIDSDYKMGDIIEVSFEAVQKTEDGWSLRFPAYERKRDAIEAEPDSLGRICKLGGAEDAYDEWVDTRDKDLDELFS